MRKRLCIASAIVVLLVGIYWGPKLIHANRQERPEVTIGTTPAHDALDAFVDGFSRIADDLYCNGVFVTPRLPVIDKDRRTVILDSTPKHGAVLYIPLRQPDRPIAAKRITLRRRDDSRWEAVFTDGKKKAKLGCDSFSTLTIELNVDPDAGAALEMPKRHSLRDKPEYPFFAPLCLYAETIRKDDRGIVLENAMFSSWKQGGDTLRFRYVEQCVCTETEAELKIQLNKVCVHQFPYPLSLKLGSLSEMRNGTGVLKFPLK